jgi:hypothetical protein
MEGMEDLVLVLEIEINIPGTVTDPVRDIPQAGTPETFLQEDALSRFEDQLSHFFTVQGSLWSWRHGSKVMNVVHYQNIFFGWYSCRLG